jgi:hypothetical protein
VRWTSLAAIAAGVCLAVPATAGEAIEALAQRVRPAVVEILGTIEGSGDTTYGTGFAVRESTLVVTNAHVLRNAKDLMVRTWDGALLASVEVLDQDDAGDLAVLRVRGLHAPPLLLAQGAIPPVGTAVMAVGHPRGYEYTVSDGIVSAVRSLEAGAPEMIQTTTPISPGSSGGPLLDFSGQVVGVCSLTLTEGQNINFAIPVARVGPALDKALGVEKGLAENDPDRMSADGISRIVRRHRESGYLTRAADLATRGLATHPKSLPLLLEAAEVAWSKGSFKEVEALVEQMNTISPGYAPARQVRAALSAQKGRCDEAIVDARAALDAGLTGQQRAEAEAVLAECLGNQGKVDEALVHVDKALADTKTASVPDYHALRAFLLQTQGRADEADREAITALEISGWDPLVLAALRERGLPRLVEIESRRVSREGANTIVRGVLRNRGPVALGEISITAESRDASGAIIATGTAKAAPSRIVPGGTGSFHIVIEDAPPEALQFDVRVIDFKEP